MKTILFVCGHNAGRSQMAEAMFNAENKNSKYIGASAGTNIASAVNPAVIDALREIDIDISDSESFYPKQITPAAIERAFRIYTMGCNVRYDYPPDAEPYDDWDLDDPAGQNLAAVRDVRNKIAEKVKS